MANGLRGSEWRKWDLHIHTPNTKANNNFTSEDAFIKKLKESDIQVFGITDYFSFNKDEFNKLKTIEGKVFFPNIEFRIEQKNKDGEFINIHVIFNNTDLVVNKIGDFLMRLNLFNQNNIDGTKYYCSDLGSLLEYDKSILKLDDLIEKLKDNFDESNYLIVGAPNGYGGFRPGDDTRGQEYAKGVDKISKIFLDSSESFDKANNNKVFFLNEDRFSGSIKKPLVYSSDSHTENDIGVKFTWIKADPTFEGLKQIINEPEDRVFIGDQPEVLKRVENNKTKYIESLKIDWTDKYDGNKGIWFKSQEIIFNKELVAIIGNKGGGKSSIADILGMVGNTRNHGFFSFLTKDRFHKGKISQNFIGSIKWEDNNIDNLCLWDGVPENSVEKVRYLPQNFFNSLTNEIESSEFTKTLENVIFTHLDDSLKLGKKSFTELKEYKTEIINQEIEQYKAEIKILNTNIVILEKKKQTSEIFSLKNKLKEKERELKDQESILEELKKKGIKNPNEDQDIKEKKNENFTEIEKINKEIKELDDKINNLEKDKKDLEIQKQDLNNLLSGLQNLENQVQIYKDNNKEKFNDLGLDINKILKISVTDEELKAKLVKINLDIEELKYKLGNKLSLLLVNDEEKKEKIRKESLVIKKEKLENQINVIKKDLSKQEKEYQDYLENINNLNKKIKEIKGDKDILDSLEYFKSELGYLESKDKEGKTMIDKDINKLVKSRLEKTILIYNKKKEIIDLYKQFKEPVDIKVNENKEYLTDETMINIDVSLSIKSNFNISFLSYINQSKSGSFNGIESGKAILSDIYNGYDLLNEDNLKIILNDFISYLYNDKRVKENNVKRDIFEQIINLEDFYNYVFSLDYLETEYELKSGDKSLKELSPGEKGTILLIFYLMIDEEGIPLIIDQPEDNLDNQSVFKMLSTFIKKAKKKRQIIIVTHNPNLAVGADAEQIIYVNIDKKNGNKFSFESGSIENIKINNHLVNILEGTMPAFYKRELKYIK